MSSQEPSGRPPPAPSETTTHRPPPDEREPSRRASQPPPEGRGLEGILAEVLRRGVSAGRGQTGQLISQLGDIRSGVVKAVALEVGHFLREADIASEVRKILLGLDIEAKVKLRFNERSDGSLEPELEVEEEPKKPSARRSRSEPPRK